MSKRTAATSMNLTSPATRLLLAFELGESSWLLGFSIGYGSGVLRRKVRSRDVEGVLHGVAVAKQHCPPDAPVRRCSEAGRDGFWLHRFLGEHGVENVIIDSASIEVNRKRRRTKTDRLDVRGLVDPLARHVAGSHRPPFSVVAVPTVEEEDLRHLGRELKLLKKDRTRVSNRIKGLLANQGLVLESRKEMARQIEGLRMWNGSPMPAMLRRRLLRYVEDYEALTERIRGLEGERKALLRNETPEPALEKVRKWAKLKGVGMETAWCYGTEFFGWRRFRNRKQVGSLAGLTPTPHQSGDEDRERGIGKDGSRWVRGMAIEGAWMWLWFQPDSELSQWDQALRKIGIVALARKLLIAQWRWVEFGELPAGALLSQRSVFA